MKKIILYLISIVYISHITHAQPIPTDSRLYNEKENFLKNLNQVSNDAAAVRSITTSFESDISRLYRYIQKGVRLKTLEQDKAVRSLGFFVSELNKSFVQHKITIYNVPAAVRSYNEVLKNLLTGKPLLPIVRPLDADMSQLMASSFSQYNESALLNDVAIYKRITASPQFILQYLEANPNFRFRDSLLVEAATHDPLQIVAYLRDGRAAEPWIRKANNSFVQQVVSLSSDKQASELMPFISQISGNEFTAQQILETRMEPTRYYQLQVNTLINNLDKQDRQFLGPLREGIRQKALAFYVNEINNLHDASASVRFASVKGLRPEDMYYIITSCGDELYTSSYLGLYKRLMEQFEKTNADSLFDLVHYDNFRLFMRLAANYNVLNDFLHHLSTDKMNTVLSQFIGDMGNDDNQALEQAMDIADSFTGLDSAADLNKIVKEELENHLDEATASRQFLRARLYSILSGVYSLVKEPEVKNPVWDNLGNYEVLNRQSLVDSKGEINQVVLFYGDEDGIASFANFQRLFTDKSKWEITRNAYWMSIKSLTGGLSIFANLPLDISEKKDLQAQDSMFAYLNGQSIQPSIIVHRGHSYHLNKTLSRIRPSMKLAVLGSCGSYNKALSFANINPDIQVIGSKKMGSKSINDPILDVINDELVAGNDLSWPKIWAKLTDRFGRDKASMELFSEYFPPSHNLSLFVLKLFKANGTPQALAKLQP